MSGRVLGTATGFVDKREFRGRRLMPGPSVMSRRRIVSRRSGIDSGQSGGWSVIGRGQRGIDCGKTLMVGWVENKHTLRDLRWCT
jgi:hypothetical protein